MRRAGAESMNQCHLIDAPLVSTQKRVVLR